MPLFLPAVRSARDVLASSLLLLVPWSLLAAAALASQGAWSVAVWFLLPAPAAGIALCIAAAVRARPGDDEDDQDDGDGGEPVVPRGPSPREPHGVALDWAAFDEVRERWRARSGAREPVA